MEGVWSDLCEKWIEKEEYQNSGIAALYVYPVDRTLSRSTGHTKKTEKCKSQLTSVKMHREYTRLIGLCTRSTGYTGICRDS